MKLFKVFFSLFVIVGLIFLVSLFFPNAYSIDRKIQIHKSRNEVFQYMSEFRNWNDWSLWNNETDSTLKTFFGKRSDSLGGRMYLNGERIGKGRFLFTGYVPDSLLVYNLWMFNGEVNANGTFVFHEQNGNTELHWLDSGYVGYNPLFRFMIPSKVSSTEKAFDEGLLRIKSALEKQQ